MPPKGLRAVYVSNEVAPGAHPDVRLALESQSPGLVEAVAVVPHVAIIREGGGPADVVRAVEDAARSIDASAVVWSHPGRLRLSVKGLEQIRRRVKTMVLIDGDLYEWPYKPVPRGTLALAALCDAAFIPGSGAFSSVLRRSGCGEVLYMPLTTDERFYGGERSKQPRWDVVVVGNRVTSRNPLRRMPGSREREHIVRALRARFGRSFAVFGEGWTGECAQGPVDFAEQGSVYRDARVAVGVNNLHAAYYFSNRLPISLSSRISAVHNDEFGLGRVFGGAPALRTFRTLEDAVRLTEEALLAFESEENAREQLREFADTRLSMRQAIRYVLTWTAAHSSGEAFPTNPWISAAAL